MCLTALLWRCPSPMSALLLPLTGYHPGLCVHNIVLPVLPKHSLLACLTHLEVNHKLLGYAASTRLGASWKDGNILFFYVSLCPIACLRHRRPSLFIGPYDLSLFFNKHSVLCAIYQLTGWFPVKPWQPSEGKEDKSKTENEGVLTCGPQIPIGPMLRIQVSELKWNKITPSLSLASDGNSVFPSHGIWPVTRSLAKSLIVSFHITIAENITKYTHHFLKILVFRPTVVSCI